ncbi:MAG: glycosyltransferase [Alphaproteobacteria bacterium]|nr:glycosyltransferase [Alphaproteobacteria bacterium]
MRVAVILPCHNEAASIRTTVEAFRAALPDAAVYVFDNASTDDTAVRAASAGAIVRSEPAKGKANAVRRAFADVEADVYVMADGDDTYDASAAPALVARLARERLDMVVGARAHVAAAAYRPGHVFGNRAFSALFRGLFGATFTDILSGYRVLSRRFVKSFPLSAGGFEIELEMAAHAALLRLPAVEVETAYRARDDGGASKLRTFRDGAAIFRRMLRFLRLHRPRLVYGALSGLSLTVAALLFAPILAEFLSTGLVPRFPTLIVAVAIGLASVIFFVVGIILDAQAQYFAETKRLVYLGIPGPDAGEAPE